ncbi:MAG: response regulator [Anaerolineae bacterium]|nr:response regulator [Anaerolineae bacterium]
MTLPTLMVVGDDASFRYLIQRYADKSACRVVFADLAQDIPAIVLQEAPGIVMVELDFPNDLGRQIVHTLKAHPATQGIPVIMCSWSHEAEWSLEEGAAVYLQKPILYDDFRVALQDVGAGQQP